MNSVATLQPAPVVSPPLSLLARFNYAVQSWTLKFFISTDLAFSRIVMRGKHNAVRPTYKKRYSVWPMLENRVFIPKSWSAGTSLPLYINIHGGGFSICDPPIDDQFAHNLANDFNFCVVSIDYRKAPSYPFPYPVQDAAEMVKAVLADTNLPVDRSKVAIGGFSAGGNLAVAIVQLDGLRGRIGSLISIYPIVDFSDTFKGSFKTTPDGKRDMLEKTGELIDWAYVPQGQDRKDPLLSPIYATREDLPPNIFFIGAEYDVLCHEAEMMALRLAGDGPNPAGGSGQSWQRGGVKWRRVLDVQHAFTHVEEKGQEEVQRTKLCRELYEEMADWLSETLTI